MKRPEIVKAIKKVLKQVAPDATAILYGSEARGDARPDSDIDLLIDFEPDVSIEEYTDYFFLLREKLTELFKRKIDLVTRRSLSNPFFIEDVEQSKQLLYGST